LTQPHPTELIKKVKITFKENFDQKFPTYSKNEPTQLKEPR